MTVWSGPSSVNALQGWNGNDLLTGAGGKDTLTGGAGADRFVYGSVGADCGRHRCRPDHRFQPCPGRQDRSLSNRREHHGGRRPGLQLHRHRALHRRGGATALCRRRRRHHRLPATSTATARRTSTSSSPAPSRWSPATSCCSANAPRRPGLRFCPGAPRRRRRSDTRLKQPRHRAETAPPYP